MIRFAVFGFASLLFLGACKSGPTRFAKRPGSVMGKEKMVKVLTDIEIAEGAVSVKKFPKDSAKSYARVYYKKVLEEHDISIPYFKKSMRYYVSNPDVMIEIQEKVIQRLTTKEGRDWQK